MDYKNNRIGNLVGCVFGRLTVQKFSRRDNKNSWWICKCTCGVEKEIMRGSLLKGLTKSCGCYNKELIKSRVKKQRQEFWNNIKARTTSCWRYLYNTYKSRAKKSKLPMELTLNEFIYNCEKPCHYCGDLHSNKYTHTSKITVRYNGLDRIDNNKGYTKDNIQTLCITCNKIKSSMSEDTLFKKISAIYRTLKYKRKNENTVDFSEIFN